VRISRILLAAITVVLVLNGYVSVARASAKTSLRNSNWRIEVTNSRLTTRAITLNGTTFEPGEFDCHGFRVCTNATFIIAELEVTNVGDTKRNLEDRFFNFRFTANSGTLSIPPIDQLSSAFTLQANETNFLSDGAEPGIAYKLIFIANSIDFEAASIDSISMDLKNSDNQYVRTFSLSLDFPKVNEQSLDVPAEPVVTEEGLIVRMMSAELRDEVVTADHTFNPARGQSALVVTLSVENPTGERTDVDPYQLYVPGSSIGTSAIVDVSKDLTALVAVEALPIAFIVWVPALSTTTLVAVYPVSSETGPFELRSTFDEGFVLRFG
jgi:hypothetical protein